MGISRKSSTSCAVSVVACVSDLASATPDSTDCFLGKSPLVPRKLVVCQRPEGGWHPWPGGRRERDDESYEETACREVHEETGWFLEPDSFHTLGWLHLQHLRPPPDGYAYPHPDFLQVVYVASAHSRDGGPEVDWTDTDGYEVTSRLVALVEARSLTASTDMPAGPFCDIIERTWQSDELAT